MAIPSEIWEKILRHTRQMLWSLYRAEALPISNEVRDYLNIRHCGLFLNIENPGAYKSDRIGILGHDRMEGITTLTSVVREAFAAVSKKGLTYEKLQTYRIWVTIVFGIVPLRNAMEWDIQRDGIYFQWGDKYKGFYLPHEMQGLRQQDALDRLCTWEAGVPSSLWQLPEGLVSKIVCDFSLG